MKFNEHIKLGNMYLYHIIWNIQFSVAASKAKNQTFYLSSLLCTDIETK